MPLIHATAISVNGKGLILRGPSGSGKSDLAARAIDGGAVLIGDDQIVLSRRAGTLYLEPAPNLAGLLEVRGVGILQVAPFLSAHSAAAIIDMAKSSEVPRLPERQFETLHGIALPRFALAPLEASAPLKLRYLASELPASTSEKKV